jgi:hypothetical protein
MNAVTVEREERERERKLLEGWVTWQKVNGKVKNE